jgi:hypothetical protein
VLMTDQITSSLCMAAQIPAHSGSPSAAADEAGGQKSGT